MKISVNIKNSVVLSGKFIAGSLFKKLSGNAIKLYIDMMMWSKGQQIIEYSMSMSADMMSQNAFYRARAELIKSGLIIFLNQESAHSKRETGIYRLIYVMEEPS